MKKKVSSAKKKRDSFVAFLFYLEPDQKRWLRQVSAKTDISICRMLRDAIDMYVENNGLNIEHLNIKKPIRTRGENE